MKILLFTCLLSGLLACDRSTSPSPESIADAPTSTTSQKLAPEATRKMEAPAAAKQHPMPEGADANPAPIATQLESFEPAGEVLELSKEEWKEHLDAKEFHVLRNSGTERPFTGDLLENKQQGIYTCAGCGAPLFSSHSKFKSGTGWPSFYQPIEAGRVAEEVDSTLGMTRTEVHCAKCGGHQGHVFRDGPDPTGLRYCINAVSMNFVPTEGE